MIQAGFGICDPAIERHNTSTRRTLTEQRYAAFLLGKENSHFGFHSPK